MSGLLLVASESTESAARHGELSEAQVLLTDGARFGDVPEHTPELR